jgi:hypothetical protein
MPVFSGIGQEMAEDAPWDPLGGAVSTRCGKLFLATGR